MSARITGLLFFLVLAVVFGLGAFLFVAADEMPVPGLILMGISVAFVVARFRRNKAPHTPVDSSEVFDGADQARSSYQYDVERRQRGEFDAHQSGNTSTTDKLE